MTVNFGLGDEALAQQHFDMTMIAGSFEHLRLPQLIDAAVADVGPVGRGILNQAHRASRPRPRLEAETRAQFHHLLVRPTERQMQEAEGIENGMRRLPESLQQGGQSRFRRPRPLGVPTHPVDDRQ